MILVLSTSILSSSRIYIYMPADWKPHIHRLIQYFTKNIYLFAIHQPMGWQNPNHLGFRRRQIVANSRELWINPSVFGDLSFLLKKKWKNGICFSWSLFIYFRMLRMGMGYGFLVNGLLWDILLVSLVKIYGLDPHGMKLTTIWGRCLEPFFSKHRFLTQNPRWCLARWIHSPSFLSECGDLLGFACWFAS